MNDWSRTRDRNNLGKTTDIAPWVTEKYSSKYRQRMSLYKYVCAVF